MNTVSLAGALPLTPWHGPRSMAAPRRAPRRDLLPTLPVSSAAAGRWPNSPPRC